jgi:hypothetical protein
MAMSYDGSLLDHLAEYLIYLSSSSSFWFGLNSSYDNEFHLSKRLVITPKDYEFLLVAADLAHIDKRWDFSIKMMKWRLFLEGHRFMIINCDGTFEVDVKKVDLNLEVLDADDNAGRRRLGGGGLDEILDVSAACIRHDDFFSRVGPERVCGCEDVVMGMAEMRDVPLRSEVKIHGHIIVVRVVQVCQKVQHHAGHAHIPSFRARRRACRHCLLTSPGERHFQSKGPPQKIGQRAAQGKEHAPARAFSFPKEVPVYYESGHN